MLYATNPDNLRLQLSDMGQFEAPQSDLEITP
jgi:hypothetical protein